MTLESTIALDKNSLFTLTSYFLVLAIFINQSSLQSPLIGLPSSFIYILVNGVFLEQVFFKRQGLFVRLILGGLLLAMLIGFVGWLVLTVYSLSIVGVTLVLFVCTTIASLLNKVMKRANE